MARQTGGRSFTILRSCKFFSPTRPWGKFAKNERFGDSRKRVSNDRGIALAEAALHECDEQGFVFAAIDLSSAIDKLKEIRAAKAVN